MTKHDKVSFGGALDTLARRAGLDLGRLMGERPRIQQRTPLAALTPPRNGKSASASKPTTEGAPLHGAPPTAVLSRVVEHYHRTFCEREDAQAYLAKRGLTDHDLLRALKVGYADGSLLKVIPKDGEVREELVSIGVIILRKTQPDVERRFKTPGVPFTLAWQMRVEFAAVPREKWLEVLRNNLSASALRRTNVIEVGYRSRDPKAAEAVVQAGRVRLRPILMTTATTLLGLLPMAIGINKVDGTMHVLFAKNQSSEEWWKIWFYAFGAKMYKPGDYTKTTPPHVKAARKLGDNAGRIIAYVMTKNGPEPLEALPCSATPPRKPPVSRSSA